MLQFRFSDVLASAQRRGDGKRDVNVTCAAPSDKPPTSTSFASQSVGPAELLCAMLVLGDDHTASCHAHRTRTDDVAVAIHTAAESFDGSSIAHPQTRTLCKVCVRLCACACACLLVCLLLLLAVVVVVVAFACVQTDLRLCIVGPCAIRCYTSSIKLLQAQT